MDKNIYDVFASVSADDRLKDSTKRFLQSEREKRTSLRYALPIRKFGVAVCAVLFLFVGISVYSVVYNTPVSYISIDVNPSIELSLNRFNKVLSAEAYNDDGTVILNAVSVKGMLYTDAVNAIVGSDAMKPYLTEDSALTFTVASDDSAREDEIRAGIENCSGYRNHCGQSYGADLPLMNEAHGNDFSFGKYSAYLTLYQYDKTITLDECRAMTMAEIRDLIKKYQEGNGDSGQHNEDNCDQRSGNNNGNGYGYGKRN